MRSRHNERPATARTVNGPQESDRLGSTTKSGSNTSGSAAQPGCWRAEAWRRWPDADFIYNEGPLAVISACSAHVKITLHPTRYRAKKVKAVLDACTCMPFTPWGEWQCSSDKHVIVDLRKPEGR
jgi:hypothetical protein